MAEPLAMLKVQVCYATPERQIIIDTTLPAGSTLHQAIKTSGVLQMVAEIDLSVWRVGVFGKLKSLEDVAHDLDRVEIYRPLIADPMESRRRRASKRKPGGGT
jgi:putative ubiquitin-RnfH superfamily antitoxin RatB of RatAB toxin-antitoxin module